MSTSIPSPPNGKATTIKDLPQELLIHILSFLYTRDAIRASRVCPSFRNLWRSIPSLNFDIRDFYSRSTSNNHFLLFREFVSTTLSRRKRYPLNKFFLRLPYVDCKNKTYVQKWIRYAINFNVSQLSLTGCFCLYLSDIDESYVEILKLCSCNLVLPPETNPIKITSLKSLELESFDLDYHDVCSLLALCVNLETLKLKLVRVDSPRALRIYSATLKELIMKKFVWDYSPVDLDIFCPNLRKISLMELHNFGNYIIRDTTLVEHWVDFSHCRWEKRLSHFTNISSLKVWDELLESNEVPAGCEQFASNVKHLELYYCDYDEEDDRVGLAALLKLLPKLETLVLLNGGRKNDLLNRDDRWGSTIFIMPRLTKVILRNYRETAKERHFIKLFKKNGVVLDKIELRKSHNYRTRDDDLVTRKGGQVSRVGKLVTKKS